MSPVYQNQDGGWEHVLLTSEAIYFETEEAAWADYKRCLAEKKSCSTGSCED